MRVIAGKSGTLYGVLAYTLWGIFPLYFTILEPATPLEILANRIIWSLIVCLLVLIALRRIHQLRQLDKRQALLLSAAGIMLSINWLTFVYAVTTNQVVEASLGYFINPLVTVALGVLLLKERLSRAQWGAIALAAVAVVILALNYGRIPWIALTLALSFAGYGLLKKRANVPAFESLTFETMVLFIPALAFQGWLYWDGTATLTGYGATHTTLLIGLGVITTLPLVLFGAAAIRIPLTSLGLLQYIAPILQFLIGVVILGETMPPARWFGFILVWIALMIFTWDLVRRANSQTEPTPGSKISRSD